MLRKIPTNTSAEFFTRERCHIKEVLNNPASPGLSIARCRVAPGVTTELHALAGTAETYLIESGSGDMDDGKSAGFAVDPGDSVTIPPGQSQRIRNTGQDDLIFLVMCHPRFQPVCYQPLE